MITRALLFLIFSAIGISSSLSCSCHNDIEEMNMAKYNDAAMIFSAKVDSIGICTEIRTIKFNPVKFYKGSVQRYITVKDVLCTGSCALSFEIGQEYLVYLHSDNQGNLKILPCGGTRILLSETAVQNQLIQAERFKTSEYLYKEIARWKHEIDFLEKVYVHHEGKIHTNYSNGKTTGEGKLKNGMPEGEWKYYYPDGNLKAVGYYKDGKKPGIG